MSIWSAFCHRLLPGAGAAGLTVAAALVLAACGSEAEGGDASAKPTSAEATPPEASPTARAPAEAERPFGWLGQHRIDASFPPTGLDPYRALLPAQFDMPERPEVLVFVADYYNVNVPPLVPYLEGAVLLSCQYEGREGWHVITMPVDDKAANDGGRRIGFPKYVADEITLEETESIWVGRVVREGRSALSMSFTPEHGATPQEGAEGFRYVFFQLVPPDQGPQVREWTFVPPAASDKRALPGSAAI